MRAWLYYRLSRDEDQEMNSLHNQRQILIDYAEQHGYAATITTAPFCAASLA